MKDPFAIERAIAQANLKKEKKDHFDFVAALGKPLIAALKGDLAPLLEKHKGVNGKTPVKGTDYFTEDEIEAIRTQVFALIPTPENGIDAVVDYDIVFAHVASQIAKLPKVKNGKDGKDSVVDYAIIVANVLKQIPKTKTPEINYESVQKYVDKQLGVLSRQEKRVVGYSSLRQLTDVILTGVPQDAKGNYILTPGGGGGGHTIQDEGTPLTQRTNLNFVGAGVTVTDGGAGPDSTIVTITSGGGGVTDGDKGDITVSASGATYTIDANVVTNAKAAQMATKTYKGRTSALTGDAEDVAVATLKTDLVLVKADVGLGSVDDTSDASKPVSTAQATAINAKVASVSAGINVTITGTPTAPIVNAPTMTATVGGAVPTPPNVATQFLNGQGVFSTPAGGGGGISGTLNVNITGVGNVGIGDDDLITYSVAGGTLSTNGDYLTFEAAGTFATSINSKRLRVKFGATTVFDTGALAITTTADWSANGRIIRTGATTFSAFVELSTSSGTLMAYADYSTGTETLANALILKFTGEGTADNDVRQELMITRVNSTTTDALSSYRKLVTVITTGNITAGNAIGTDYTYIINGAHTLSLPAASGNTNTYTIKNTHTEDIIVETLGTETIELVSNITMIPRQAETIISDGTNFIIIT